VISASYNPMLRAPWSGSAVTWSACSVGAGTAFDPAQPCPDRHSVLPSIGGLWICRTSLRIANNSTAQPPLVVQRQQELGGFTAAGHPPEPRSAARARFGA
jgi:hypothetical protein